MSLWRMDRRGWVETGRGGFFLYLVMIDTREEEEVRDSTGVRHLDFFPPPPLEFEIFERFEFGSWGKPMELRRYDTQLHGLR